LIWDSSIHTSCIPHYSKKIYGQNSLLFGVWDGGSDAFISRDYIIEDFDGCRNRRIIMDNAKVWAIKSNQWEETDINLSPPAILKENN
jgi:hypothetical protein